MSDDTFNMAGEFGALFGKLMGIIADHEERLERLEGGRRDTT